MRQNTALPSGDPTAKELINAQPKKQTALLLGKPDFRGNKEIETNVHEGHQI